METVVSNSENSNILAPAAKVAFGSALGVIIILAILHFLSPEFDPSWRMVSEYANGEFGWVLSLMFLTWALSSWTLAFALKSQLKDKAGKIGLFFLVLSGLGELMAAFFDINHSLHSLASLFGIGSLPIAATLIAISLGKLESWKSAKPGLKWTATLTWLSVILMGITFGILIYTYTQSGAEMSPEGVTELPDGVVALVGWANRLLIVIFSAWLATVAKMASLVRIGKLSEFTK